jgi:hypothetical protein
MDCDYDSESDNPLKVTERANAAIATIIPGKSKIQNEKAYIQFREWCTTKNVVRISEKMLLAYLDEKSAKLKPPTLWSTFSMLKAMLNVKENIDVRKVPTNVPYLKKKSVGYRGKKSKILTPEDISKFIEEAADEKNLLKKVMNTSIHIHKQLLLINQIIFNTQL